MKRFSVSIPSDLAAELQRASDLRLDHPSYNQLVRESLAFYLPVVVTRITETGIQTTGRPSAPCPEPAPARVQE